MNDEEFDKAVQDALDRNKAALMGSYSKQLGDLLKLSDAQLSAIIPEVSKTETYNNLISVIKEASRANIAQADMLNKVSALGQDAVKIAKLAGLFV